MSAFRSTSFDNTLPPSVTQLETEDVSYEKEESIRTLESNNLRSDGERPRLELMVHAVYSLYYTEFSLYLP